MPPAASHVVQQQTENAAQALPPVAMLELPTAIYL
jgi:hypothetical protein